MRTIPLAGVLVSAALALTACASPSGGSADAPGAPTTAAEAAQYDQAVIAVTGMT